MYFISYKILLRVVFGSAHVLLLVVRFQSKQFYDFDFKIGVFEHEINEMGCFCVVFEGMRMLYFYVLLDFIIIICFLSLKPRRYCIFRENYLGCEIVTF